MALLKEEAPVRLLHCPPQVFFVKQPFDLLNSWELPDRGSGNSVEIFQVNHALKLVLKNYRNGLILIPIFDLANSSRC